MDPDPDPHTAVSGILPLRKMDPFDYTSVIRLSRAALWIRIRYSVITDTDPQRNVRQKVQYSQHIPVFNGLVFDNIDFSLHTVYVYTVYLYFVYSIFIYTGKEGGS